MPRPPQTTPLSLNWMVSFSNTQKNGRNPFFPTWHPVPRIKYNIKAYIENEKKKTFVISLGILLPLITQKSTLEVLKEYK